MDTGNKKRIAIIGAMDVEVEELKAAMMAEGAVAEHTYPALAVHEGAIAGMPVVVTQCNVGMVNAAAATQLLIDEHNVAGVLNTGVAGSLDPVIDIGDIVVATDAVNHIMDVCNLGYEPGQTPGLDALAFKADKELCNAAKAAASELDIPIHEGRVASGDRFVRDDAEKARISAAFNASCCEMEGASIAQVCHLNKVPFAILRAISDKADGADHIDYPAFEAKAARDCAELVIKTLDHLSQS